MRDHRCRQYDGRYQAADHIAFHDAPPFAGNRQKRRLPLTCSAACRHSMVDRHEARRSGGAMMEL